MERFREVQQDRHRYAQHWQSRTGGRVVGYLCAHVPEEVFYAFGILPVRLLGGHQPQDVTEPYIFSMFCAYCRDTLAQGLRGKYAYLNGIVLAHVCTHIRQTYESWRHHLPTGFHHLLWMPSQPQNSQAPAFFLAQTQELVSALEAWTGQPLDPVALHRAVAVYNHNRRLLRRLYEFRRQDPPALSGAAAMEIVLSGMVMDKAEHNQLLEELLGDTLPVDSDGVRLMLVGSENDDIELVRLLEALGAVVVIEDNCLGNRYFWNEVLPADDLLPAIAQRYLDKPPCPVLDVGPRRRATYLLELAREFNARGLVYLRQKFCDPHGWEFPIVHRLFQEHNLPTLSLELDFTVPVGQYRTRIEAFMELFL